MCVGDDSQPFDLSDLSDCEVLLLDQCDQVQVDNLTNCRVFIGPCSESVFVRNCTNCVFTVAWCVAQFLCGLVLRATC